jgi:hypothetical protein
VGKRKKKGNSRQLAKSWPYPRHLRFRKTLEKAAAAWFKSKGHRDLKPAHILPSRNDWRDNIILPEVADYVDADRIRRQDSGEGYPLHKYAHHGLSSQALAFNLLGPLVARDDLEPLRDILAAAGIAWRDGQASGSFEVEDRAIFNEDSGQPTSIDFMVSVDGAPALCVEVKLVEPEFGGCSVFEAGDCDGRNPAGDLALCYLHHIGRRYWTLLQKHGFLGAGLETERLCALASHYQFFREVLLALEKGAAFVLLCDDRSPTFMVDGPLGQRGLIPLLLGFVPEQLRGRIGVVTVRQLLEATEATGRHEDWTGTFRDKYALEAE